MKLLQGLETSLGLIDPPSPAKSKSAAAAADVSQLCLNVNEELNNLYRQSPDSKLVARNRTARIQHGLPPNYEAFKNPIEKAERATASKQQADQKTKFDLALRDSSESNKVRTLKPQRLIQF